MKPDYLKWKKSKLWTAYEAACLLVDVEPPPLTRDPTNYFSGIKDKKKRERAGETYRTIKDAIRLRELPAVPPTKTPGPNTRIQPLKLIVWAEQEDAYNVPSALRDVKPTKPMEIVSSRERTTFNRIIGALLDVIMGRIGTPGHPSFKSEAELINHLVTKYDDIGLKERTLQGKFADAKKSLKP